jgi:CBS domain-containing protein
MSAILHFGLLVGTPLRDDAGERLGKLVDLIVRRGAPGYPPISGLLASVAGRHSFLDADQVVSLGHDGVWLTSAKLDLRRFERRAGEVLLGKDVLDRQLINVEGARLVRANDIELARVAGWYRVVGVDIGPRGALRRLLPRPLGRRVGTGAFLDWASVEPFVGHVPTVRLRVPHPKLARLHPAQIADLVEAASHGEGEEIIAAVRGDRELEADVFEELDEQHQAEFLAERSDGEVAEVLGRMAADDAADVAAELDDERRERVLDLLGAAQRTKVRALLGYDAATAGGLMSPDFVWVYRHATVAEALDRVRRSDLEAEVLSSVYLMTPRHRLDGAIALADLVRTDPEGGVVQHAMPAVSPVRANADIEELSRLMADFNLTAVPVVDDERRMIGLVTVDDVLEVLLPKGWRRRFGLLGGE